MLDLHFFQNPRFSAASAAIMLVFLALFGTIFLLTQYLQSVLGYSTLKAGAILIPQSAALMIFAFLSPRWVVRFGNKAVVAVGPGPGRGLARRLRDARRRVEPRCTSSSCR